MPMLQLIIVILAYFTPILGITLLSIYIAEKITERKQQRKKDNIHWDYTAEGQIKKSA